MNITRGKLSIEALNDFKRQFLKNNKGATARIPLKTALTSRRKKNTEFELSEAVFYKNLKETNKYNSIQFNFFQFNSILFCHKTAGTYSL